MEDIVEFILSSMSSIKKPQRAKRITNTQLTYADQKTNGHQRQNFTHHLFFYP